MQSENSVAFKVFVSDGGEDTEVRRFSVDRSAVTNFEYMKAKIQSVFPSIGEETISITWKDEEGDHVLISSDEELILALSSIREDLKKLYVKKMSSNRNLPNISMEIPINITPNASCMMPPSAGRKRAMDESACEGEVHPCVTCDGCEGPVSGYRYKCIVCEDYDLCSTCEGKNIHPEHFMMRIPVPVGYMGRVNKIMHKVLKKSGMINVDQSGDGKKECPYMSKRQCRENKHEEGKHSRHYKRHHGERKHHEEKAKHSERRPDRPHCQFMKNGGWMDTFATYMNEFANLAGDIGSQAAAAAANATATPSANASASASANISTGQTEQQTNGAAKTARDLHEQYLKNVGITVAKVLNPLGIDVDVEIRPNNGESVTIHTKTGEASSSDSAKGKDATAPPQDAGSSSSSDEDSSDSDSGRRPEGWTFVSQDDNAKMGKKFGFDVEKMAKEFQKQVEIQAQASSGTGLYPTIPMPDVSAPMEVSNETEKVTSPPPVSVTPPQQTPESIIGRPLRPNVLESYNRMLAMGFKDDGGRLIRLLEAKNGNIGEVLDVLSMNIPSA